MTNSNLIHWNSKESALLWLHSYPPPNRPSNAELAICSYYLSQIRKKFTDEKIKILILGTTKDFLDWSYIENLEATVIDHSKIYFDTILENVDYKELKENPPILVKKKWQEMNFCDEFHIVVGDLIVGNIKLKELQKVTKNIHSALLVFFCLDIFCELFWKNKLIYQIDLFLRFFLFHL